MTEVTQRVPMDHVISEAVREAHGVSHQDHLEGIDELVGSFYGEYMTQMTSGAPNLFPAIAAGIELGYYREQEGIEFSPDDASVIGQTIMDHTDYPGSSIGASMVGLAVEYGSQIYELEQAQLAEGDE